MIYCYITVVVDNNNKHMGDHCKEFPSEIYLLLPCDRGQKAWLPPVCTDDVIYLLLPCDLGQKAWLPPVCTDDVIYLLLPCDLGQKAWLSPVCTDDVIYLLLPCDLGQKAPQPTTCDHINIKYIWGPHVNHMGTPR